MPHKPIHEMVEERYSDPEVRQMITDDIEKQKTAERIESGELSLPSEQDATNHLRRLKGILGKSETEIAQQNKIQELEARLHALEGGQPQ